MEWCIYVCESCNGYFAVEQYPDHDFDVYCPRCGDDTDVTGTAEKIVGGSIEGIHS